MEMMVSRITLPTFSVAYIFLNSSVSAFPRCIQMLLVMCNPLQVRVCMDDKERSYSIKDKLYTGTAVFQACS